VEGAAPSTVDFSGRYVLMNLAPSRYMVVARALDAVCVPSNTRLADVGPDAVGVDFHSYRSNAFTMERLTGSQIRTVFAGHAGDVWETWESTNCLDWTLHSSHPVEPQGVFVITNAPESGARFFKARKP